MNLVCSHLKTAHMSADYLVFRKSCTPFFLALFAKKVNSFNPVVPNTLFLYRLKTSENRKVFYGWDRERVHLGQMS